jgi:PAS domain S-box-containing protein
MAVPPRKNRDAELIELRARLAVAEETLDAIRKGEVDALLVGGADGDQVFTLQTADKPYRLLIEAMNEGALTVLLDGTILYCNSRFAQMVGLPIENVIGASVLRLLEPRQRPFLRTCLRTVPDAGFKAEFALLTDLENEPLPVQLSLNALEIDGVGAVAVVATDLTERKKHEAALLRQNEELERRVAESTADLIRANNDLEQARQKLSLEARDLEDEVGHRTAELEESVKSLEQFCYTIAHDLRAPLRAMHGFGNALLTDSASTLSETERDYAQRIVKAAARMDDLIRDLLAYGRLNSADLQIVPTDPVPLLEECAEGWDSNKGRFEIRGRLPRVLANPIGLKQVFENLLGNALKFVRPGVPPEISVSSEEHEGWVRINIQDNGIGIAPEHHQRVFRVFERLSPGNYHGTGIGLAIVQKGIERMGGKVGLQSKPGHGSRFWIELPAAR